MANAFIYLRLSFYTFRQIQNAIAAGHPTPQKKGTVGRKTELTEEEGDELKLFICSCKEARFMSWLALSIGPMAHLAVGPDCLRKALAKRGYKRYIARAKPPLSPKQMEARLAWAYKYEHWTIQQWASLLWTDETWVTGGRHRRQWVTRKAGEELHANCMTPKIRKWKGWMFWGSFAGFQKGPACF